MLNNPNIPLPNPNMAPNVNLAPNVNAAPNVNVQPNPIIVDAYKNALAQGEADPDTARDLLSKIAEKRIIDMGIRHETRAEAQYRKALLDQGISESEADAELADKFADKRSETAAKAVEFDNKIKELKDQGPTPEGAWGHDIEIHLLQAELYPTQLADLQVARANPTISPDKASQLDNQIRKHLELQNLQSARENLKDASGVVLPDQVVGTISKIATDIEKPQVEQNPIGYLQTRIGGAMRNPNLRAGFITQLVDSGMINQSDSEQMKALFGQMDPKEGKKMNKAVVGLGIAGLLMFLMIKMAAGSAAGGQQQGHG